MRVATLPEVAHETFDLAFATWWSTVYEVPHLKAGQYAYFVQDIESLFYMDRADPSKALAEKTYTYSLPGVTVSNWARDRLKDNFGLDLALAHNGIDKALYQEAGPAAVPRQAGACAFSSRVRSATRARTPPAPSKSHGAPTPTRSGF